MGFFLLLKPFWPLIWRAIAAAILVAALWWAWAHFVKNPYIAQGARQEHVHTEEQKLIADGALAANATFKIDLAKLQASYAQSQKNMESMRLAELEYRAAVLAEIARQKAASAKARKKIDEMVAIASGPPAPTKEEACEDADRILDDLATRRLLGLAAPSRDGQRAVH